MNIFKMVLSYLGVSAFSVVDGKKTLTQEQREKLKAEFGEAFLEQFEGKLSADDSGDSNQATALALAAANSKITQLQEEMSNAQNISAKEREDFTARITSLQNSINLLTKDDEADPKPKTPGVDGVPFNHTVALFGATDKEYMLVAGRPYNQRAAASLAAAQGLEISASSSIDYSKLSDDLGAYYRTRTDSIKSMVQSLKSVESVFPLYSGYQDQHVLLNMFLGEFSQSFQDAFTPKGTFDIEPEILKMYDVKFDHKFTKLKELEKQWIGYLNREGSSAMKMSFIEFLLSETIKKLHNERELRRVSGVYVAPVDGVAGNAINGADGLRTFIKKKIANKQIKTFALGAWNNANIGNVINAGTKLVPQVVRDTGKLRVYGSTDAYTAYKEWQNLTYGKDTDYKGTNMAVKFMEEVEFVPVPNMGSSRRLIWSVEGNIALFEDRPNEMSRFEFEQEDRTLKVWSDWREGVWAFVVGKKWANENEMDYEHQLIWCNDVDEPADYFVSVEPNDATPSVSVHSSIATGVNTGATAITNIDDMAVGQIVIVKCGSDNAYNSTIAKSGNFANMTAAWNPAYGDTITLFKRGASDIIDLTRTTATTDAVVIAANDATPDVSTGSEFVTSANTAATAITTLDNATPGETYTVWGGSNTNSSTIANSGNFSLTAAMTLSAGAFIRLYARTSSAFVELSRG